MIPGLDASRPPSGAFEVESHCVQPELSVGKTQAAPLPVPTGAEACLWR